MAAGSPRARLTYIDWARGIAVLLMIEAHIVDAWTRPAARASKTFAYAIMLGGFAAPLFLWLAGVGVALAAASVMRRSGSRAAAVDAVCRRGLEIFILAFLFRLQSFVVTPGSYPITLFRVDILNVMGPGMVIAGIVWGSVSGSAGRVAIFAALAFATAMVTPIVRAWTIDALPLWIQWYLRPFGEDTTFTLLPWSGFVFAGAACGVALAAVRDQAAERRTHAILLAAGAACLAIGFVTSWRPTIYASSSFWTSSPTYFAIRAGVLALAVSTLYWMAAAGGAYGIRGAMLERFGRSSLFVYWIHVELVYGYASWPLRHRLPLWAVGVAYAAFTVLMFRAVVWRDRIVDGWNSRRLYRTKDIAI